MAAGQNFADALAATKTQCVFTTHTPVEAGHDRFSPELMDYALHGYLKSLPVPSKNVMALGRVYPEKADESFCMTVLALKARVRPMASASCTDKSAGKCGSAFIQTRPVEKVPIDHITNGIHLLGWMKGSVRQFLAGKTDRWRRRPGRDVHEKFGHDWASAIHHTEFWKKMADPFICFRRRTLGACATNCAAR